MRDGILAGLVGWLLVVGTTNIGAAAETGAQPTVASSAVAASAVENGGDFNGDGYADLAVSAPEDDVRGVEDAGTVNVIYGGPKGLQTRGNQFWTQDTEGVLDESEKGDLWGRTMAAGDWNSDGYDDLAIGSLRERVNNLEQAGGVNILYGSASGLTTVGNQWWTQDSEGVADVAEKADLFGGALHAADWNGDGIDDLAIGAWQESLGDAQWAGALHILFGSLTGLTADGSQFWTQDSPGMAGDGAETSDLFARQVADGDFNNDGSSDIAIGVRLEGVGAETEAGAVNVMYGSATGLTTTGSQFWTQDSPGMPGDGAEAGDWFGRPVTVADYDNDGYDDLLIGSRFEDVDAVVDAGSVHVLYGSTAGLTTDRAQYWTQNTAGLLGDGAEERDWFGHQAGAGDFNGDGYADAAIGPMGDSVGTIEDAGAVNVLYGSAAGLSTVGNQWWTQDSPGIPEDAENQDWFSFYLWSKDFNADGFDDLAATAPFDSVDGVVEAGVTIVMFGSPNGLMSNLSQVWSQNTPRIKGDGAEIHDLWGGILA